MTMVYRAHGVGVSMGESAAGGSRAMGHHIDREGRFQSDRYPDLDPDKIVVSFKHPQARRALAVLADDYASTDPELAADIRTRLESLTEPT